MSTRDAGGPAFPLEANMHGMSRESRADVCGMTLRDYFAAQVLGSAWLNGISASSVEAARKLIAQECYAIADAMLKERGRG